MVQFGTDGVRGRVGTELTLADVRALGTAAAGVLGDGVWLIGRDTRESGADLELALASGLAALGATPWSIGVVPTPALAAASERLGVPAAMITASHNPFHDNGVKVFAAGGTKLSDDVESSIAEAMLRHDDGTPFAARRAEVRLGEGCPAYRDRLLAVFPTMALDGVRVVLDCANGAMSAVAPEVVRALGADVTVIHDRPNGRNINDACGATSPMSLAAAVVAGGADLGLAFDGDGDRVIAVDHTGAIVDGDRLIALAALQLRERGLLRHDTVVVTVMTNLGFLRAMEVAGIHVVVTSVGDRYVLEALERGGFSIGGEQSGHIIYPQLATTGDGLLAGVRLAHLVRERGRSLAELAGEVMVSYPQVLVNVQVAERHPDAAAELAPEIGAAERALGGEGRVLVRASGTEPLVRVMIEAPSRETADLIAAELADAVRRRFG